MSLDLHKDMVGLWLCPTCSIPTPIEETDGTRCACGLQMVEIKPAPKVITGIEREMASAFE